MSYNLAIRVDSRSSELEVTKVFSSKEITLEEAKTRLVELVLEVTKGGEVVLVQDGQALAKLVPTTQVVLKPGFGGANGLFEMADDFDEPLDDFASYLP